MVLVPCFLLGLNTFDEQLVFNGILNFFIFLLLKAKTFFERNFFINDDARQA
jgi:hypothetical protein